MASDWPSLDRMAWLGEYVWLSSGVESVPLGLALCSLEASEATMVHYLHDLSHERKAERDVLSELTPHRKLLITHTNTKPHT